MKKSILVISAVLALAATGTAQNINFGIKAGLTHNTLNFKIEAEETEAKLEGSNAGFYVGGIANFKLSENFSLQPNLLFVMKGGRLSMDGDNKLTSFHIDLPVNFLYTANGFFIGAGPNFSYALSGKVKANDEESVDIFDKEEASYFYLKKFELGANVLMGYTFPNGLVISASYTPGIANIAGYKDEDVEMTAHNKSFGISIGYMFGAKGK
jgi:hypothetical protein